MTFEEFKREICNNCNLPFGEATARLQSILFGLSKAETLELISQIGSIPENIVHDSTEEKLYTKASDIILAKSLYEMNLEVSVLTKRADCADVVAQSQFHGYSLVADAKAFRLSRTARNAKDYKVNSMSLWKGDCDYSVLICPYFQYPQNNSQIYKEALNSNVALLSWEHLYILLKNNVKESPTENLCNLWNQSEIIGRNTPVSNSKSCFLTRQNANIAESMGISLDEFNQTLNYLRKVIADRGRCEIKYFQREVERIQNLNREEAIAELINSKKLDGKISTIINFINQIESTKL